MKYMLLAAAILTFSCTESTKTGSNISATDTTSVVADNPKPVIDTVVKDESAIGSIRAAVQAINSQTLQVQTFNWRRSSCADEASIRFFLDGGEIRKIVETGFIGDGGWVTEYYYNKGKFIFSYMQHIGGPAGMPVDTSEIRKYVDDDTLVLMIKNKESHTDIKQKFSGNSKEYKLLRSLKNKDYAEVLCEP